MSAVLIGVHRGACSDDACTGCFPDPTQVKLGKKAGESEDRRRTRVNGERLAAGIHPATLAAVRVGTSETCGDCQHHHGYLYHSRNLHKCDVHRLGQSHSAASDVRVSWPACVYFDKPCEEAL